MLKGGPLLRALARCSYGRRRPRRAATAALPGRYMALRVAPRLEAVEYVARSIELKILSSVSRQTSAEFGAHVLFWSLKAAF